MEMIKESDIIDEVAKLVFNQRQYASYFDFRGDREGTELDTVRNWIDARYPTSREIYASIRHCPSPHDPPDVIATTKDGLLYGFEVTELVDAETVRRIERHNTADFKEYSKSELIAFIKERVERKSAKPFKTTCDKSFLLIYSDEPDLCNGFGYSLLSDLAAPKSEVFSEIWFMIPPEVNISGKEPENPNCQIFIVRQI